jgi:hypothetical protein
MRDIYLLRNVVSWFAAGVVVGIKKPLKFRAKNTEILIMYLTCRFGIEQRNPAAIVNATSLHLSTIQLFYNNNQMSAIQY